MKIGFIGAGKVGTAFGLYMREHGHTITGYMSRTYDAAQKSADLTNSYAFKALEALLEASDVVLITTPDTEIAKFVNQHLETFKQSSSAIGHMSGTLTSEMFEILGVEKSIFSLHPLQAFATVEKGRQDLKTCTFVVEGNTSGIAIADQLMTVCSNKVISLKREQKPLYHGAACVTSNYMMVVTALAEKMIAEFDLEGQLGLEAYRNLMVGAIDNAIEYGSAKALTGPIARGDLQTIQQHLDAMDNENMKKDYSTLGMMTLTLASKEKLTDPVLIEQFKKSLLGKKGVRKNER